MPYALLDFLCKSVFYSVNIFKTLMRQDAWPNIIRVSHMHLSDVWNCIQHTSVSMDSLLNVSWHWFENEVSLSPTHSNVMCDLFIPNVQAALSGFVEWKYYCSVTTRAPSLYNYGPSRYGNFLYKDKTVGRPTYFIMGFFIQESRRFYLY